MKILILHTKDDHPTDLLKVKKLLNGYSMESVEIIFNGKDFFKELIGTMTVYRENENHLRGYIVSGEQKLTKRIHITKDPKVRISHLHILVKSLIELALLETCGSCKKSALEVQKMNFYSNLINSVDELAKQFKEAISG